ncbi:MAG TPA: hypothetical protein VMI11_02365 [Actinomycetes bacterium]|nr:hypothetical protein [Actinomycetes bacterium]
MRNLRAVGAFVGGLAVVMVGLMLVGSVVGGVLHETEADGQVLGRLLFYPGLIGGALLGVHLARRSLAKTRVGDRS